MKNIFSLFCFVSIVLSAIGINSFDTQAQTVLFSETFNEANNATTGTSAEGISWTATCPACVAGDYYHVVNGAMEGQDTNGAAEWITGNITVPMGTQFITLTTTYNSIGYAGNGNLESQDECGSCPCDPSVVTTNGSCNNCWDYVAYTVSSGGSTVGNDILLGCAGTADDGSLCQPLDVSSLTASGPATITMEVEMAMWASSEKLSFDDVIITAYTPAQATAAGVTAGSCPAPPICDLTLGAAAITCNAYTSGTSDAVTINVPYTGMDPDAVLSILVNGSAASNIGSNPAVTANGTITFAATEGATYSVGFTDATCNLQSLSGTVSTTQCLAGCSVNIASVTPTCNGTNYDLAVTFTHSSPISTAAANITVKDGATTLASQSNVTTTGSSQTVNFTNVAVGNTTPGITVTVADVNSGGGGGSTTLAAGDIAIVNYQTGNDAFCFIALVPIPAGTTIKFTDNAWTAAAGPLATNEGTFTWTAPAGGVACGAKVCPVITGIALSTGGDQILAYQGLASAPTFIAGVNANQTAWLTTGATSSNNSYLPTGLTNGTNAMVTGTTAQAGYYSGATLSGTKAVLLAAINNASNWTKSNTESSSSASNPNTFTVTGCGGVTCEATATFTEPDCTICTNPPTVAPEGPYTTCVGDAVLLGDAAFGGSATMAQWSITAAAGGATIADGTLSNTAMTATPATVTFTGAVAGTYTLTLTSNNPLGAPCTAASLTTTVNVIADQVGTLSYPKATYCANEADPTPTVTGGSTDDEFTSTTGLVIDASTGVVDLSASTPGTYTVTYRTSLSAACPGFATFSITINAAPTAGITIAETSGTANDGTVCAGSAITLTATGGTSYNWTLPDASTSTTNPQSIASAVAADAGTYTVAVTNAAGCTATTTTAVVVNALPTAGISITETSGTANDGTVCAGSAITLTATGGTSYNWTLPDASTSTTNPQSIASAVAANAGTYTVTVTNAAGCTATATTAVVVNALPTAGITIAETSGTANDGTVCAGSAITLTATGGTSYNWTLPDASTSTTNPQSIASAVAANAGTYTVAVTNAAGCTATTTTAVVVNALPTAGITIAETSGTANDGTVCAGSAITLTATGGTSYNWTLPDASTSTTNPQSIASAVAADAGTYTVAVTNAAGCTATTTTAVVVNALPTAGITIAETSGTANDGTVCAGSAITLTATGGTSYNWTLPDASTFTTNPQSIASAVAADAGTYTVAVTNAAGCTATTTTAVVVNALPTAGITIAETSGTANDGTVCAGSAITLTATGGTSYNWTLPDASTSTTNPQSIASAVAADAGTYTVAVTNAAGCTATTTTAVVVNALPTAGITIAETSGTANDGTVCAGSAITLTATGGTSYNWTLPDASTSTTNPQSIASAVAADAGTYTVAVTNAAGCTATTTTAVVVNALPTAGITIAETSGTANDGTVCAGSAITLTATSGTSYNWTLPDASTSTTNPQSIASAVAADAGTYTVTVTNAAGCTATTTTAVVVNALPTAGITIAETSGTANDGTVCAGSAITLTATGGTSYNWTLPDASTSTTNPQSIASAVAANAGTYTVAVTNAAGCTATTTTAVVVNALPTTGITIAETSGTANDGTVCAGSAITLTATGGTSYNWTLPDASTSTTNPQSIASAVAANAGTYTVAVTNAAGCTATTTTAVVVNNIPTFTGTASCSGGTNTGSISQTATGGSGSYTYGITGGSFGPTLANNTYTVTVISNGCSSTAEVIVNCSACAVPTPTVVKSGNLSCTVSSITLSISGLVAGPAYTYQWTGGSTNATLNVSAQGTYTVTVTNPSNGGCTATSSLTVARRCTAITDPCSCVNDASSPVGAAPNDGHFNEMIAIWNDVDNDGQIDAGEDLTRTSPSEIAYVTTQSGMLNLSNVAYPTSPAFGTLSLTYGNIPASINADGSIATLTGVMGYYLIFRHTDAAGYTANVTIDEDGNSMTTGDQFPEPTMAATCFYPNPTFSPVLTSPLCTTDAAITLGSNPSGASFTINSIAATSFNPATLGTTPNPHVVELTLDPAGNLGGATPAASGCIQAIKANVVVQNCVICMPNAGSW